MLVALSAYGMEKEGRKSSGLSLACLSSVASCNGQLKEWPNHSIQLKFASKYCCSLLHDVNLIIIDDAQPYPVLQVENRDLHASNKKMFLSLITFEAASKEQTN